MNDPDACLTIVAPHALEDQLVDLLLEYPQWVSKFTVTPTQGRDWDVPLSSTAERVRGRGRDIEVRALVRTPDAGHLIERMKTEIHAASVMYWLCPVTQVGRLG